MSHALGVVIPMVVRDMPLGSSCFLVLEHRLTDCQPEIQEYTSSCPFIHVAASACRSMTNSHVVEEDS